MDRKKVALVAFSFISGIGCKTLLKLLNLYPDLERLWSASNSEVWALPLTNEQINNIITARADINIDNKIASIQKQGINILTILDDHYPKLLKQIYDPPAILYYQGDISILNIPDRLAVVGTRKISNYAKAILPNLLKPIVNSGIVIVSGLALGVDGLAHQIAVSDHKPTIAVLGSGLDWSSLYPPQNFQLAQQICHHGLLVSEYPPGTSGVPGNFPMRNRIISGLCQGTLVVEAALRSGSLITAYQALEQNREVMAIPGSIHLTNSQGTNKIIQRGAKMILEPSDILSLYHLQTSTGSSPNQELNKIEKQIINLLVVEHLTIEKIYQSCKIDVESLNATLTLLELKGLIKQQGSYYFINK
ncbi:MAG: DNA protecting protein DprA [Parcubacteria group bacterium CG1_02_37_51]|uniref:DNA-protecting protein DprA n=2 Tax=Candidatus Komeiliibacteriota TaxID=1817908 RepID=A0A2M8DRL4_9BACT|nr:MAG: DNA protecting protein DprA [Parcubacteria group bacterium CG1_02_37_51]PIY95407.1 MAG: DNA-protecting protein DprA [Candidatus Komeilibacteria bacterium CG_4_10_14_0_8_um_filter_37_78]PJC01976.1 MAG: DNA-protecting protein DprA [Candidatus Komeilibacteria bacterium CG_4_9_14_0_8_um_filter_36_9]